MAVLRKKYLNEGYVYLVDFRYQRERHVISTRTSDKRLALQVLKEIEGKIVHGTFRLQDYERRSISLKKFFVEYFPYAEAQKGARTVINERNYAGKLVEMIGDRMLDTIDVRVLEKWKVELLRTVSPTTFNIERKALQAMFNIAIKWGYLVENPFKSIQKLKIQQRRLFLKDEELEKILRVIVDDIQASSGAQKKYNEKFLLLVLFLLNTGMRRSEALRLTKSNIDLSRGLIVVELTKSKKTRIIPMNDVVRKIVDQLDAEIFSRMEEGGVTHKFMRCVRRAGLVGFHLHSLRHTYATRMVLQKIDIYTVSLLLGHADIRTSMVYAKPDVETLRSAVKTIEDGYDLVTLTGGEEEKP